MPRDGRTFITVHDGLMEHPKIEPLSDKAFRTLFECWTWCSKNTSDGVLPPGSWSKRGTAAARRELVAAGLMELTEDGGAVVHDYTEHQRTAAEIEALRAKRREAGSKGGKAKATAVALAKQTGSKALPESETDRTRHTSSSSAPKRATRIPNDWKPSAAVVQQMRDQGVSDFLARQELPKFVDYWTAKSGQSATKTDWDATWRNWLRTAQERAPQLPKASGGDYTAW